VPDGTTRAPAAPPAPIVSPHRASSAVRASPAGTVGGMAQIFGDDELPEPLRPPKPSGWYEVFCCGGLVLTLFAVAIVLAIFH
jgi:hypothetical protein